jgi:phosphoglycolate phosphatase
MYKLLVFDWDGTLMDSEAGIVACMQAAFRDLGLEVPSREAVRNIIGLGLSEAIESILPDGFDQDLVGKLVTGYRRHFLDEGRGKSELFPAVEETLERLEQSGYLLAVATGKGRPGLDRVLEETGLGRYFIATRCADETFSKPHPQMLNELVEFAGVEAAETLMIGDTEYDLQMANNAGTASIAVSYGVHEVNRLLRHGPVACVDAVDELPDCISSLSPRKKLMQG